MQKRIREKEEIEKEGTDLADALNQIKNEGDFTDFLRQLNDVSRDGIPERQMSAACSKVVTALGEMEWGPIGESKIVF